MLCFWETMGTETGSILQPVLHIGIVFACKRTLLSEKNTKIIILRATGYTLYQVPTQNEYLQQ